jgi:hypothetical protein
VLIDVWLAKKFLFLSELIGPGSDIASKRGFFGSRDITGSKKGCTVNLAFA